MSAKKMMAQAKQRQLQRRRMVFISLIIVGVVGLLVIVRQSTRPAVPVVAAEDTTLPAPVTILDGAAVATDSLPTELPLTASYLAQFRHDPVLRSLVTSDLPQIPRWNALIGKAWAKAPGLQIDLYLQEHYPAPEEMDPATVGQIFEKQLLIAQLLERDQQRFVGVENFDLPDLTEEALRNQIRSVRQARGIAVDEDSLRVSVDQMCKANGPTLYKLKYPTMQVVGCDPESLHSTHAVFMTKALGERLHTRPYAECQQALRVSRSMLILATAIESMHAHGETHGALVIGSAHGPELMFLMRKLRIKSRIYDVS